MSLPGISIARVFHESQVPTDPQDGDILFNKYRLNKVYCEEQEQWLDIVMPAHCETCSCPNTVQPDEPTQEQLDLYNEFYNQ